MTHYVPMISPEEQVSAFWLLVCLLVVAVLFVSIFDNPPKSRLKDLAMFGVVVAVSFLIGIFVTFR